MLYESRSYDKHGIMPKSYGGYTTDGNEYGQWSPYSFKVWDQGMKQVLTDKMAMVYLVHGHWRAHHHSLFM